MTLTPESPIASAIIPATSAQVTEQIEEWLAAPVLHGRPDRTPPPRLLAEMIAVGTGANWSPTPTVSQGFQSGHHLDHRALWLWARP